jgi:chitinase
MCRILISSHRLDGIDLDVEKFESLGNIEKLIKQLRTDFGADFIITLAPVASALKGGGNLSGFDYKTLEQDYGDEINWYNAQFYSGFGSMNDPTDYNEIVSDWLLDPSRLVAGTLSNKDNGDGWVKLDTVKSTVRQLMKKYGNRFGGIAAWEYYNSKPDTDEPWTWAAVMQVAMVNWKEVLSLN